jgi:hypothetical protein
MIEPRVTIHAVHDRDIGKYWDSLGLSETELCYMCKGLVTKKNVAAFLPVDGIVKVVCNNPLCFFNIHYLPKKEAKR